MEKYLKMSDMFGVVGVKVRGSNGRHIMCDDILVANCFCTDSANYTAHAINSHDELLAMNKELLAALEWSDAQIMEFISIAFRHAEIRGDFELSDVRDALNMVKSSAISKAKGGAA